ncbi:hypothetical protein BYT27DRAFT_7201171 [Phlegmacium glaucopus]|nr:hypothetical protein BYT27DRAFT_7201171 [Phlegmacium glaucopus]
MVRRFSEGLQVAPSIFLAWISNRSLGITWGHLMSDGPSSPIVSLEQVVGNHGINSMKKSPKSCNCDDQGLR